MCLYLPYIHKHNLLHYYKAGDQASSGELLADLRHILNRCKEYQKADFLIYELIWTTTITTVS